MSCLRHIYLLGRKMNNGSSIWLQRVLKIVHSVKAIR